MKAPTVDTYQQYVLFRQHARKALEAARAARRLHLCMEFQTELGTLIEMRDSHIRAARFHWRQVEMMEV